MSLRLPNLILGQSGSLIPIAGAGAPRSERRLGVVGANRASHGAHNTPGLRLVPGPAVLWPPGVLSRCLAHAGGLGVCLYFVRP